MTLPPSYLFLCAAQGAVVLAPLRIKRSRRLRELGLLLPVAMLGLGVGLLRAFASSPQALAWLATIATPLLAACLGLLACWRRPWLMPFVSVALYLVAWQVSSWLGEAAAVALIGLACLSLAAAVGRLAPPRSIAAGLVVLAVVDVVLVWGTPQVGPAANALERTTLPTFAFPLLRSRPLPSLQQATFGATSMGWLDLLAPALLCALLLPHLRRRAAIATGTAACLWGLLLLVTSPIPATVPVLAGLLVARRPRQLDRLEASNDQSPRVGIGPERASVGWGRASAVGRHRSVRC